METQFDSLYLPAKSVVEKFSDENRVTLTYDMEEHGWSSPHIQMGWVNPSGHMCSMYLNYQTIDSYHLHVICWGVHQSVGRKDWDAVSHNNLAQALSNAKAWADQLR